jgi:hypothetical protein
MLFLLRKLGWGSGKEGESEKKSKRMRQEEGK